jgi:hypothetical protein
MTSDLDRVRDELYFIVTAGTVSFLQFYDVFCHALLARNGTQSSAAASYKQIEIFPSMQFHAENGILPGRGV